MLLLKNKTIAWCFVSIPVLLFSLCGMLLSEEFIYDGHEKKDPFSPPILKAAEKAGTELLSEIQLEGIIWDQKNPIAIINDKVVKIGDEVSGAKVVEIFQNEVMLDIKGQTISVKLHTKTD